MVDLETIEREIQELEARGDTTYSMCERLAWLYIVKDHLAPKSEKKVSVSGSSEFMRVADGLGVNDVMRVIDEHMEALKAVYPREYEAVMNKLRAL